MGFVREFSLPKQLEFHPQAISENNSLLWEHLLTYASVVKASSYQISQG